MPISWRSSMMVDGGKIDDDHRYLIDLINQFEAQTATSFDIAEVNKILSSLKYYTVYHFAREEAAQKAARYPSSAGHAIEHKKMIAYVDTTIAMLENYSNSGRIDEINKNITIMLRRWLIDHILKFDLDMRPYIARMRPFTQGLPPLSSISSRGNR